MESRRKLRLLILRDLIMFAGMLCFFYVPYPFGMIAFFAAVFGSSKGFAKPLKAIDARLEPPDRRSYFVITASCYSILLCLLALWILLHASTPAYLFGGLGTVVLLVLFYAAYDSIYGSNAKV